MQVLFGILGSYTDLGYGVLAVHHVLFEAATLMNIITVTVYWSLLHDESYAEVKDKPVAFFLIYYIHIVPILIIFANFMITDVVFKSSHYKIIPPVGITYAYVNYLEVKRIGKPIYSFWTWEDYTSVVILFALMSFFLMVWFGVTALTLKIKRGGEITEKKSAKKAK